MAPAAAPSSTTSETSDLSSPAATRRAIQCRRRLRELVRRDGHFIGEGTQATQRPHDAIADGKRGHVIGDFDHLAREFNAQRDRQGQREHTLQQAVANLAVETVDPCRADPNDDLSAACLRPRHPVELNPVEGSLQPWPQTGDTGACPAKCRVALSTKRSMEAAMASGEPPATCGVSTTFGRSNSTVGGAGSVS